jgi:hypothetical protein
MKVKVIKPFIDKYTGTFYKITEEETEFVNLPDFTEKRAEELIELGYCEAAKKVEPKVEKKEEKKKKK